MCSISIQETINNNPGYSQELSLKHSELDFLRNAINLQWENRINLIDPEIKRKIIKEKIKIKNYHQISNLLKHSKIWPKKSRILPNDFLKAFTQTSFFKNLEEIFGNIQISDEEDLGFGNIYWRLVRPFQKGDIGPYHRDSWFWELNKKFPRPSYSFSRVKVWIAIETESGKSGLLVESNSHRRENIKWEGDLRDGIMKPKLLENKKNINMKLLNTRPGNVVLFNDDLLHGGALNTGKYTRVSTEFTLLIKNI